MVNTFTFDLLSFELKPCPFHCIVSSGKKKETLLDIVSSSLGCMNRYQCHTDGRGNCSCRTVTRKIVITPICLLSFDQEWKFFPFLQKQTFCLFSFLSQERFLKRVKSLIHPTFSDIIQMFRSN